MYTIVYIVTMPLHLCLWMSFTIYTIIYLCLWHPSAASHYIHQGTDVQAHRGNLRRHCGLAEPAPCPTETSIEILEWVIYIGISTNYSVPPLKSTINGFDRWFSHVNLHLVREFPSQQCVIASRYPSPTWGLMNNFMMEFISSPIGSPHWIFSFGRDAHGVYYY